MHTVCFVFSLALRLFPFLLVFVIWVLVTEARGVRLTSHDFPPFLCRCWGWFLLSALSDVIHGSSWRIELQSQNCVSQVSTALCANLDEFAIREILTIEAFRWCYLLQHSINHLVGGRVQTELSERLALLYRLTEDSVDEGLVPLWWVTEGKDQEWMLSSLSFPRIIVYLSEESR